MPPPISDTEWIQCGHATQSVEFEARRKQSTNLQRRYGYLEKAFEAKDSHCLA